MVIPEAHHSTVGDFAVRYFTAGRDGPPVVLLHGGGTDSALLSWRETIGPLAESYRVYVPDWPGYGESELLAGRLTQETLLRCLEALLDAWDLDRVTLVGISMGGGAAIGYTLAHPDRVARLVPVASYGWQDQAPLHKFSYLFLRVPGVSRLTWASIRASRWALRWTLKSIVLNPESLTDDLVDEVYQVIQSPQPERSFYTWQMDEMRWGGLRSCYMPRLAEIACPTLIIHGAGDSSVPVRFAREAAERIPGARLHIIANGGHWIARDWPDDFNRVLLDFLRETD